MHLTLQEYNREVKTILQKPEIYGEPKRKRRQRAKIWYPADFIKVVKEPGEQKNASIFH
jgi:hypothetical protein